MLSFILQLYIYSDEAVAVAAIVSSRLSQTGSAGLKASRATLEFTNPNRHINMGGLNLMVIQPHTHTCRERKLHTFGPGNLCDPTTKGKQHKRTGFTHHLYCLPSILECTTIPFHRHTNAHLFVHGRVVPSHKKNTIKRFATHTHTFISLGETDTEYEMWRHAVVLRT